ncbi:MAG: hypothetical protein ACUVQ8_06315 [Nitrososphaeria archaeon]
MQNSNIKHMMIAAMIVAIIALSPILETVDTAYAKNPLQDLKKQMAEEQKMRMEKLKNKFDWKHLIFVNKGPNFVDFISVRTENSLQTFSLKIHYEGVPTIYVVMLTATKENGENKTAEWVKGILRVTGLIEYVDKNGDDIYTPNNDTRLQWVNFAKLDWKLIAKPITVDDTKGWAVNMTAEDRGAIYSVRTKIFNTGIVLEDNSPVAPTEAKVDFIFENFPWSNDNSRLALISTFGGVSGTAEITHYDDTTEVVIERNAYAYFTWANTAYVDNEVQPVKAYQKSDKMVNVVELNYPRGENITHDPIVGIAEGNIEDIPTYKIPSQIVLPQPTLPSLNLLATVVLVAAIVGAIAIAARKLSVEPKYLV